MPFPKLFSINPSDVEQELQNKDIAMELADKISGILEEFKRDVDEGIPIINESLSKLAKKDQKLAVAILDILKTRHAKIHSQYPFKID